MHSLDNLKIAVIGLGYVGLPLAVEFAKTRPTLGFDINETRIAQLRSGLHLYHRPLFPPWRVLLVLQAGPKLQQQPTSRQHFLKRLEPQSLALKVESRLRSTSERCTYKAVNGLFA